MFLPPPIGPRSCEARQRLVGDDYVLLIHAQGCSSHVRNINTVEPRYVELGYLELHAISNRIGFPLDLPLFFQSFTMGYLELGYPLEHPAISNCCSLPLAQINPGYLEFYYIPKKHWSKSVRKYNQGTPWQDVLKAREMYWRVHGNEKSDWLDLPLRM